jgi:tetratricopeptide (TPR) repeat protein
MAPREVEQRTSPEELIARVSEKFRIMRVSAKHIIDIRSMETKSTACMNVLNSPKGLRRRLTSLTDVQPQLSFDEADANDQSRDDVDRGYHTDPSAHIFRRKHLDEDCPRAIFSDSSPADSSESSEESCEETTLENLVSKGSGLEKEHNLSAALSLYDSAVQGGVVEEDLSVAYLQFRMGVLLWKCGSYEKSLSALKRAHAVFEGEGGMRVRVLAEIYYTLGRTLASLSNRKKARKYFMKALRTIEYDQFVDNNVQQADEELYAKILSSVGSLLVSHGSYEMASSVLDEAITLQRRLHGEHHADIAGTLLVYGSLNEALRQYEFAARCYLQALDIYRNQSSTAYSSNVDVAVTLSNIGWLYYLSHDYSSAKHSYEEALELMIPILGSDHRNVSSLRVQMGMVLAQQGNLKSALKLYRQALEGQRRVLGDEHEDVALTLSLVGSVYKDMGRSNKAAEFTEHSLAIRQQVVGPRTIVVGTTLVQLGQIQMELGDVSSAAMCFATALNIFYEQSLPASDSRVAEASKLLVQVRGSV